MSNGQPAPFVRRPLDRTRPNRTASNFYRSTGDGTAVGGIPLRTVEDGVVAAVRMGYKVAAEQIERTARLGRRLRSAADQAAGADSDRKALDATEQIVFNAMMAGLNWVEGLASDSGNPLKRLATAEYRILGSLFGLGSAADKPPAAAAPGPAPAPASVPAARPPRQPRVSIRLEGVRRPVQVTRYELNAGSRGAYPVVFYGVDPAGLTIDGTLIVDDRAGVTLSLNIPREAAWGAWKAAVCDDQGMQIGYVEIAL